MKGSTNLQKKDSILTEIPRGWTWVQLIELVAEDKNSIKRGPFGSAIKKAFFVDKGYKVYEQQNAIYNNPHLGTYFINKDKFHELQDFAVGPGDFIVSCSGTIGRISQIPDYAPEGIINQALLKITIDNNLILPKYFLELFRSEQFQKKILQGTRGSAMKNISAVTDIKTIHIQLPPIFEQHRIVENIEELFTKLDAGVDALKKIRAQLKRYRQSVLKSAFEGKLTEEWRKKNNHADCYSHMQNNQALPNSWQLLNLNRIISFVTSGSRGWAKYYSESGPIFLRVTNLEHGIIQLDLRDTKRVNPPINAEKMRTRVQLNDILISITADVGMVAVIPDDLEEAYINQHIALIRPVKATCQKYLAWYLVSENAQNQFKYLQRGATKMGLGLDDIRNINIPYPSLIEQEQIVNEIEYRFTITDSINTIIERSLRQTDQLRQGILKTAFEGKLVQQDPNDEPAEKLLERIKAGRLSSQTKYHSAREEA